MNGYGFKWIGTIQYVLASSVSGMELTARFVFIGEDAEAALASAMGLLRERFQYERGAERQKFTVTRISMEREEMAVLPGLEPASGKRIAQTTEFRFPDVPLDRNAEIAP